MAVELTPNGTYGTQMPKIPRPIARLMFALIPLFMRRSGANMLMLTTIGSKSGQSHTVHLGWFPAGDQAWYVVASAAGAAKHPAWYYNMAKNPDKVWIEINGKKLKVQPQSLKGPEREAAWKQIVTASPNYGAYETKTDRQIPVIRLQA